MVSKQAVVPGLRPTETRKNYARIPQVMGVPNLIAIQMDSYRWFQEKGLRDLFEDLSPIRDQLGNRMELWFDSYEFREPRHSEEECRTRDITFSASLYVKTRLLIKSTGEIKEESVFFGDIPMMTGKGTFITSGAERVVVSQLLRSPGVYFTVDEDVHTGRNLCRAKLIPTRGAWLEFETNARDLLSVKINGKRKIPITTLLRAIGYGDDEQLLKLFVAEDTRAEHQYIQATLEKEPGMGGTDEALMDIYRKLRPGDPPSLDNARKLIDNLFFNPSRYDLGRVGRYKLSKRLGLEINENERALTREDIVEIVRRIIMINNDNDTPDEIDHLGNRRVRTVGELVQNQFRIGLIRTERVVKERMSISASDVVTPSTLVNIRPVVAAIREFFGGSQLSQFMDQTNPLAELTHKRRLSAMGPGGLSRDRAGFDVRDVHFSHYGRICPIETPEGPNIGLIGSPATYSVVNEYGFIETPYRVVLKELGNDDPRMVGHRVREDILDEDGGKLCGKRNIVKNAVFEKIKMLPPRKIAVLPFVSDEIVYLTADKEDIHTVAQATVKLDDKGQFVEDRVEARLADRYLMAIPDEITYMDVSPKQIVSVATALIPFLEHDDANRALMGANMQRQSVPLILPQAPIVATGMEYEAARHSGQLLYADYGGTVSSVTSSEIVIERDGGETDTYKLKKFVRTNQGTCINQRPRVSKDDRVGSGHLLADSSATENGELALGQNVLVAFMSWEGYNYEDAIILSERVVADDKFASIHIAKYEVEARDTKLGPEEITRDIPNVGEESLRELDEIGVIRIGAEVGPNDILVGKITPKGETELSAEEKLLRAIFGEKAREVKDTSLRVPHGEWGKVINVKEFSRDNNDELSAGVNRWVQVWVAQKRRVSVGDKLSGRHGNKGVISLIAPVEDMPYLPDGTPVDIVLNPIGVPSRMNLGQVLETHLGWAAETLGIKIMTPVFDGATDMDIEDALGRAWIINRAAGDVHGPADELPEVRIAEAKRWLDERGYDGEQIFDDKNGGLGREACLRVWLADLDVKSKDMTSEELEATVEKSIVQWHQSPPIQGKTMLRDGRTGTLFDNPVTVGNIYVMKLIHMVEDKVHARSTGPYSLITQQPLGGKAQFGGQRFGEMEVWALEAYSAAHNLQEFLTIKSDDVTGRAKTYEAIVKGEPILQPGIPESFKVLVKELQSLGLSVEVISDEDEKPLTEDVEEDALTEAGFGILGDDVLLDANTDTDSEAPVVVTDEVATDEAATDEVVTDEAATDEAATDEAATDEAVTDEAVTDEAVTDEVATDEVVTDEVAIDEAVTGEAVTGEAVTDEAATGEVVTDEAATDEAVTDEVAIDEAATDEAVTDEAATDEAATDEVVTDEAVTDEAVTDEAATDEAATDEAATDEAVTDEAATDEAATDEAATDEVVTDEVVTDEAATDSEDEAKTGTD
jgi:DNA-directed RNA polymerase subunit beta